MMTDADDIIRGIDIPERMQIAQAGIHPRAATQDDEGNVVDPSDLLLLESQLDEATLWVAARIGEAATKEFLLPQDGAEAPLRKHFLAAVKDTLHFLCVDYFEVPFIWVHRRDYFIYHDPNALIPSERSKPLLGREDLWKVYSLAIKYRAMLDRKSHLHKLWSKLNVEDSYFNDLYDQIDSLEEAGDLVEYVTLKYQSRLKEMAAAAGAEVIPEDAEADMVRSVNSAGTKLKRATGDSKYEKAKNSLAAAFAQASQLDTRMHEAD